MREKYIYIVGKLKDGREIKIPILYEIFREELKKRIENEYKQTASPNSEGLR